jgi:hypothetical protein
MSYRIKKKKVDTLAEEACRHAAARMRGDAPALASVEQLLTPEERIKIGRRVLIAQAILHGKTRYEINELLSVSPNTYAQVRKWLSEELPAYTPKPQKVTSGKQAKKKEYVVPFSYEDMKRRYPMHFLLFAAVEKLFEK